MYQAIKILLQQYAKKKMTLEQLNGELLALNPYMVTDLRWNGWEEWVNSCITAYADGDLLALESLCDVEDDDDVEDEYINKEDYMLDNSY